MKLKVVGLACLAVGMSLSAFGCSSDSEGGGSAGNGGSGASGGTGNVGECMPKAAECYVDGPTGPGAECLAKADNSSSDVWTGRFSYLKIDKPAALANKLIQEVVVNKGIGLNQEACNETGDGTFTWLIEFDSKAGKLKTGGGYPITDPKAGACFVSIPNSNPALDVKPAQVDVTVDDQGKFGASVDGVVVPIFLDVAKTKVILLPLHGIDFDGTFSADHNCVGKYNGDQFTSANLCLPDTTAGETTWTTGGHLKGYITIEEAEEVYIDDLSTSLCAQIAGADWKGMPDGKCSDTDAWKNGERPEGDWCSTTNAAATADCKDAWALEAGFAASAIKINGDCQ
ncbi:MAG: hypothetical protein KC492_27695 [Myxococcales bacterium]|nr:hypothetical protein [Myxococcales bacterium]